ncbi:WD40 repeat-like protein [Paxillus ammoniavirescens]|nr:WD40 repeat-like protein [Paxillus ammoniavirescens]
MLALPHSVSPEIMSITSAVASVSSQSVSSMNTNHPAPLQVFEGHTGDVNCACFYPDEKKLVSGSWDHTLRIWDRNKGAVEVLRGHTDWVRDVDVSWDGRMIVSGSDDTTVRIWKGDLGEVMRVFKGHKDYVKSVQFSADSRRVVSGSDDWTVRVWTVETGKLAFKPIKCFGFVDCVRYSPSGDRIASGGFNIQVWDAQSGRGILFIRNSPVYSLAWTADGTQIIGGGQGTVTVWNSHNGEQLRTWPHWRAHDVNMSTIKLSLSPTGIHVATQDGRIQTEPSVFDILRKTAFVFNTSTGGQIAALTHNGDVRGIIYSPSGRFIATACGDGKLYLWEAPAFKDPQPRSSASSFSSFLDRPAISLARPSPNDRTGVNLFWDSSPEEPQNTTHHDQQASSLPRRVLNRVRDTFSNLVTGRITRATQNPLTETVELIGVAAGKDKPVR